MKCPYQTKVIHKPESNRGYEIQFAQDITRFGECLKSECPYYIAQHYESTNQTIETCRKVESEVNK